MSGITDRCERRRVCAAIGTRFLKWMIKGRAAPRKGEQDGGESESQRQRPGRAAADRGKCMHECEVYTVECRLLVIPTSFFRLC
ncbi:hypothetical protein F2P79_009096 [Pimephales promelas]|nr:hypothetical protein F2P79_009096 [Pimephales promelas]